jgi:NADP-dependent 3-hydroxy acid dehydrogenase YdfG
MTPAYKTVLIVGAGHGLSASLARLLAQSELSVALAARNPEKLSGLCAETGASAFACDAQDRAQVARLFEDSVGSACGPPYSQRTVRGRHQPTITWC